MDLWTAAGLEERLRGGDKDGETDLYIKQKPPDDETSDNSGTCMSWE